MDKIMDSKKKFKNFLESLKGKGQDALIESVKSGFKACFEESYESAVARLGEPFRYESPPDGPTINAGEEIIQTYIDDDTLEIDALIKWSDDALIDNIIIADTEENREYADEIAERGFAIGTDLMDDKNYLGDKWFEKVKDDLDAQVFNKNPEE